MMNLFEAQRREHKYEMNAKRQMKISELLKNKAISSEDRNKLIEEFNECGIWTGVYF